MWPLTDTRRGLLACLRDGVHIRFSVHQRYLTLCYLLSYSVLVDVGISFSLSLFSVYGIRRGVRKTGERGREKEAEHEYVYSRRLTYLPTLRSRWIRFGCWKASQGHISCPVCPVLDLLQISCSLFSLPFSLFLQAHHCHILPAPF